MSNHSLKNLVNYYFRNKISIFDAGCHKGGFLKKIGFEKLKSGILVDPIDYKLIKNKKLRNFIYFKKCLGPDVKFVDFYLHSKKNPEWSSLFKIGTNSPYKKKYNNRLLKKIIKTKIQQTTIDNILKNDEHKFDILKIDCQSNTFNILRGARKSLKNKKFKMIIAAINITEFYNEQYDDFSEIITLMKKNKFKLYNICNCQSGLLGKIDYDFNNFKIWGLDAIFIHENLE